MEDLKKFLGEQLGANYDHPSVFNKAFAPLAETIAANLPNRNISYDYAKPSSSLAILEAAQEHAKKHNKPLHGKNVLVLVHPFYPHLLHEKQIRRASVRGEVKEYTSKLIGLLRSPRDANTSVVAFETAHGYAAASSLLLEQGLIDQAIFTHYNLGSFLNVEDRDRFKGKTAIYAGAYNDICFTRNVKSMRMEIPDENIWAVKDLVLASPIESPDTMIVDVVSGIAPERTLEIEEFKKRFYSPRSLA
jgi:hypothetical protein